MHSDSATLEKLHHLSKQVDEFKNETDQAKKIATRKQIEVDAVLVQSREIAYIDQLTHLPNRQLIVRELQSEVLRASRYKTPFTISMLDVDHFKRINDANGHLAGDETLKRVGQVLREHIRHPDLAGRYGGEEFLILLPNSDTHAASEQAARLCSLIRDMNIPFGETVLSVTVSIGIAEFRHDSDSWDSLLNRADTAMYEAKSSGRDRWIVASS
jgi:diguanylate cyclase (GGDEF)-like protein